MSIEAMKWAFEQKIVKSPSSRHVLLCMSNYAGKDGDGCFASVGTLAEQCGMTERTVQRCLRNLLVIGAIEAGTGALVAAHIQRVDRRPKCYRICIGRDDTMSPRDANGVTLTTPRGDIDDANGVTLTTPRGDTVSPDPLVNQTDDPLGDPLWRVTAPCVEWPPGSLRDVTQADLPPGIRLRVPHNPPPRLTPTLNASALVAEYGLSPELAAEWLAVRRAKRGGLPTRTAMLRIANEANAAGLTLEQAITECSANSWVGFKAEWLRPRRGSTPTETPEECADRRERARQALSA